MAYINKLKWCSRICVLFFWLNICLGLNEEVVGGDEHIQVRQRRALQGTGQSGQCGLPGPRGIPGRDGHDGRDGRDATLRGPPGVQGERGPPGPKAKIGGVTGGAVYTRWGRDVCPKSANMLYSGVIGGSHYTHSGGGSNYLCLPLDPIYEKVGAGLQGSSYIYGTEYAIYTAQSSIFPTKLQDHDAPCAVCHTDNRGSHVMIPARNVCPTGWTLEYKGYLMTGHHGHKGSSEFICVDGQPTPTIRGHADQNGALLFFVEGLCGSLPCGPYIQGNELTCAVCTK